VPAKGATLQQHRSFWSSRDQSAGFMQVVRAIAVQLLGKLLRSWATLIAMRSLTSRSLSWAGDFLRDVWGPDYQLDEMAHIPDR
jgi:hypothetical protein